jgi:hypothetical protein
VYCTLRSLGLRWAKPSPLDRAGLRREEENRSPMMKMHICIPLKLSRALAIFSLLQMGVTNAYSQAPVNADTNGVTNKGSPVFSLSYCQGENQHKIINYDPFKDTRSFEHFCDQHPYTQYATCNATTDWIAENLCKSKSSPYYTIQRDYPPTDGNRCGYAWFTVTCWSGVQ